MHAGCLVVARLYNQQGLKYCLVISRDRAWFIIYRLLYFVQCIDIADDTYCTAYDDNNFVAEMAKTQVMLLLVTWPLK